MSARKLIALAAIACTFVVPATAQAGFGIKPDSVWMSSVSRNGTDALQASSHPYAFTLHFALNANPGGSTEGGEMRDAIIDLPPGFVGNPQAVPSCPRQSFEGSVPACPPSTQIGVLRAVLPGIKSEAFGPLYNLTPVPGAAAQLGFSAEGFTSLQFASLKTEEGYGVRVSALSLPLEASEVTATIWGTPADPDHTPERGPEANGGVPSDAPLLPYLTMPATCGAAPEITVSADSKLAPGEFVSETGTLLDQAKNPASLSGCEAVPFTPKIASQPSSHFAEGATGLDFELKLPNQGLLNPGGTAETEPQKVEVTLPEGVTANPSAAEGLGVCSEAQYKAEQIGTKGGEGCPEASKLGSLVAHSPLIQEPIEGSLYLAKPYENPSNSLIALYIVARAPERGVLIKQAGKVEPDPKTGQLITTFEGLPPLPYSDFKLHFREGARAPLITPPACGQYETVAKLTPFSASDRPFTATASFQVERGVDGGACPSGALPFGPGFEAASENNAAGAFSPFFMRLTRRDGDQDLTKFSAKLPPGLVGRLAGTAQCSDAAIAQARSRTGPHGGAEEKVAPSCPSASQIGSVWAGAGVGGTLTYVPGSLYLAGPYQGAPLSVVAIVPAVAGPFDVGTVVTREALRIDPLTAEVEADGSSSDPIPHILRGIPLKVRDIRVFVDKPDFTLNPTSCSPSATKATIWAGGVDVFGSGDDSPFSVPSPFQAADCASLPFKPTLSLKLKGGSKRGGHPALTGTFAPRKGDANLKSLVLRLPRSAFLDQGHIRTICTRVQFAANGGNGGGCPAGAVYGKATAYTPLLDQPLSGPVYLRSSNHNLPDFVAALHGTIDVEAVARIDSKNGGIRATFPTVPDAPLSKVVVQMQGGKKGLIVNSRNLCGVPSKANADFTGHNGKAEETRPVVGASCGGKGQGSHKRHRPSH
jgi:hypothetical protein